MTTQTWFSQLEMNDEAVHRETGRWWHEWCELIDAWPGSRQGHQAIAKWLEAEHQLDG